MKEKTRIPIIILSSLAVAVALASCASTRPIRDAAGRPLAGSVAFVDRVELGGVRQFVCARGRSAANPVLLYVHGGPGSAMTPIVVHYNGELEKNFIVVNWDQRGAGMSFSRKIPRETMTIDRFVEDGHELVTWLKAKFGQERIYLVGHSWGSILGTLLVQRYPDDFIAYAGTGQFVRGEENELLSYRFTLAEAKRLKNAAALRELMKIGEPVAGLYRGGVQALQIQRKWLDVFRGSVYSKKGMNGLVIPALLSTTEYAGINLLDYAAGSSSSLESMWPEVVAVDLEKSAPSFKIPVYFLIGRHDWNTPRELAVRYFNSLSAPAKSLIWFEDSGHCVPMEEPAAFDQAILRMLEETSPSP